MTPHAAIPPAETSVPPVLASSTREARRRASAWVGWISVGVVTLAMVGLYLFPPQQHSFYPRCGLHAMTGLHCPGCGSLRALHHLTHGRWLEALHSNALLVLGLGGMLGAGIVAGWRGRLWGWTDAVMRPVTPAIVLALLLAFGIARNLPWAPFQWLAP